MNLVLVILMMKIDIIITSMIIKTFLFKIVNESGISYQST